MTSKIWERSSVWLERMPVTHEVASSSLVVPAIYNKKQTIKSVFISFLLVKYAQLCFFNNYDLFFNAIVYILPALVFFIDKPGFNNVLCYVLLCIGFSIFMCVSAWDSNNTIGNKITASVIKIITGIEVPLVLVFILLTLLLIFGGKDRDRRNRNNYNNNYNYNYSNRRNRW